MENIMTEQDKYFAKLDAEADEREQNYSFNYGGGYEASKGDFEGACLARAEYEAGQFS